MNPFRTTDQKTQIPIFPPVLGGIAPRRTKTEFSLSRYFPANTEYFYGYPAEEDSHFFNGVPPEIEELVAARTMLCTGPHVKTICFPATTESPVWEIMQELEGQERNKHELLLLPKEITYKIRGSERNKMLKEALAALTTPGNLVMAQPYLNPRLKNHYRIPPHRTIWLNDKRNMISYIPWQYLTKTYDEFLDGQCFEDSIDQMALPCVVKVSSSSSGDGVRICHSEADIERAKEAFSKVEGIVMVSERISVKHNFGIQFGIPYDPDQTINIIGWHEQLTNENGAFIGGIIERDQNSELLKPVIKLLREKILPEVRRKGWFGIGGFDVLMSEDERFYFVDPNFRMTGMTVFDLLVKNDKIKKSLLSFMGVFEGSEADFREKIMPIAKVGRPEQKLYLSCLSHHDGVYRFNAALLFDEKSELAQRAKEALDLGIDSDVLEKLSVLENPIKSS